MNERRSINAKYDGRAYALEVDDYPVNRCLTCGATTLDVEADEATELALHRLGLCTLTG